MKHLENSNLWLSVVVGVGILFGVGLGAYISTESTKTSANADFPPACSESREGTVIESCTDGQWTPWNLTDNPKIFPQFWDITVAPHSRSYIGIKTITSESRSFMCGTLPAYRGRWRVSTRNTNTVCNIEQQDLKDPETDVTTINEEPGCKGVACDTPPSF